MTDFDAAALACEQDEALRLAALDRYGILDTPAEQGFDDIVLLAAQLCDTPVALISLVAAGRQWFKARTGFAARETPIAQSVCVHTLRRPGLLIISDLAADPRTCENTLVTGAPHIRFYAGARLETAEGEAIGALCVIDTQPRPGGLLPAQREALEALARQVMAQLELRRTMATLEARVAEKVRQQSRTWQISPDLHGVLNANAIFESSNPAWQSALGWSEVEIASTEFFDFLHPDDLARNHAAWDDALLGRPALKLENRYRRKDGGYRWLSWVAVPEGGKVYCSARDITAEKEQAEALRASMADRERMWRLSQDLLVSAAADGTLVDVNAAWSRLLGWDQHELTGRKFVEFTHPEDLTATVAAFADILKAPLTLPYEYRLRHKDGSYRWFAWTGAFDGNLVYASGRDVTGEKEVADALRESIAERQRIEEALRQSQKMEAVGQLTGGLAHDFNNLLTGITGGLEMLQARIMQGRISEADRYIVAAQGAAKRATALTHRLLAFSRRQTLDPKPTDVNRLVAGMEDLIRRTVGPEIAVETVASGGLWNTLVDPSQLENALLNLSINARDAMPGGGKLTIETANRWLDARAARERDLGPGQYVALCVSDNGAGMSTDTAARAFDPFFTTKPIGMGTGLGLSMVYGFVRQSGGQARIYSEVGRGTMVCLYLPRHIGEAEPAELAPEVSRAPRSDQGETVLVVDDEPTVRMLVVDVLEDLGYNAIEAGDGGAGLKVLRSDLRIDLLITDVGLPGGMNGRQLADAARAMKPELKVLFITGYAENAVLNHGHLEPGMHVVTKPFAMEALASRIRDLVAAG